CLTINVGTDNLVDGWRLRFRPGLFLCHRYAAFCETSRKWRDAVSVGLANASVTGDVPSLVLVTVTVENVPSVLARIDASALPEKTGSALKGRATKFASEKLRDQWSSSPKDTNRPRNTTSFLAASFLSVLVL